MNRESCGYSPPSFEKVQSFLIGFLSIDDSKLLLHRSKEEDQKSYISYKFTSAAIISLNTSDERPQQIIDHCSFHFLR